MKEVSYMDALSKKNFKITQDGVYSDVDNKLIYKIKDKVVYDLEGKEQFKITDRGIILSVEKCQKVAKIYRNGNVTKFISGDEYFVGNIHGISEILKNTIFDEKPDMEVLIRGEERISQTNFKLSKSDKGIERLFGIIYLVGIVILSIIIYKIFTRNSIYPVAVVGIFILSFSLTYFTKPQEKSEDTVSLQASNIFTNFIGSTATLLILDILYRQYGFLSSLIFNLMVAAMISITGSFIGFLLNSIKYEE